MQKASARGQAGLFPSLREDQGMFRGGSGERQGLAPGESTHVLGREGKESSGHLLRQSGLGSSGAV